MLAAVGTKLYWRRPEIPALVAVAAGCTLLTFFSPADTLLHLLPLGHTIAWSRSVMVLPLALAVLAAFGAEAVVSSTERETIVLWAAWALGGAAVLVVAVVAGAVLGLTPVASHQLGSLIGPGVELVVAVAAVAALKWTGVVDRHLAVGTERLRRYVVVALARGQRGFSHPLRRVVLVRELHVLLAHARRRRHYARRWERLWSDSGRASTCPT